MKIQGGCYCGRIRFEAGPETKFLVNCHCANCRRSVGAQAVAYVVVARDSFSWTKGNPGTYKTDTDAIRTFCDVCGSSLTYESATRKDHVDIVIGCLDNPDAYPPEMDYFSDEKVSWVSFQTGKIH